MRACVRACVRARGGLECSRSLQPTKTLLCMQCKRTCRVHMGSLTPACGHLGRMSVPFQCNLNFAALSTSCTSQRLVLLCAMQLWQSWSSFRSRLHGCVYVSSSLSVHVFFQRMFLADTVHVHDRSDRCRAGFGIVV